MGAAILTSMLAAFQAILSLGMHNAGPATLSLYKVLATIEIAGLGIWWLYSHDNTMGVLISRVLTLAVFLWIMQDWQNIVGTIQASFMKLGILLGGNQLDMPSVHGAGMALIDKGYEFAMAIQGQPSLWTTVEKAMSTTLTPFAPFQSLTIPNLEKLIMGWMVWGIFAMAGIHVFVTQLEFAFYSAVAFVTVPFATWNRTAWISERTFGAVLSVGLKLTFLYALTSASLPILKQATLPATVTQQDSIFMLCTGFLLLCLQMAAGRLASGLLHGMPSLTHSDVLPRLGTSVGLVTGGITMATRAMTNAANQIARGTQRRRTS